jgi:exopolysaccharide biosynthesis protein
MKPEVYNISFVKAHAQVFGRETLAQIAKRTNADIAINGGFFEIGGMKDGQPSKTLIIDGGILRVQPGEKDYLIKRDRGKLEVASLNLKLNVKFDKQTITPAQVNDFTEGKNIVLYSHFWGPTSLTPYKERREMLVDKNLKIVSIVEHGNNPIPAEGYIISFPQEVLIGAKVGGRISIELEGSYALSNKESLLGGVPALVLNGVITTKALTAEGNFYHRPHARTAVGIKEDGTIILVVAEHAYKQVAREVTLGQARTIMAEKKLDPNKTTVMGLWGVVEDHLTQKDKAVGLTIKELAQLMLELGCKEAINLDGGGSASLFINGKIINKAMGDEDESMGQAVLRPISDAIVFKQGGYDK